MISEKEKKIYENVEIEVFTFITPDIVTTSGGAIGGNDIGEDYGENDGEWL